MGKGLEQVKVGDRVWLGQFNYRAHMWKRFNLDEVSAVTAKKFRVKRHPKNLYDKATGVDYKGAQYCYYAIATPQEIEDWEAAQLQKKQDEESAETKQKQLYQESCERARRLFQSLWEPAPIGTATGIDNNILTIHFEGHRYRIKEIEE